MSQACARVRSDCLRYRSEVLGDWRRSTPVVHFNARYSEAEGCLWFLAAAENCTDVAAENCTLDDFVASGRRA